MSLPHTSEKGKKILKYDSKEKSLKVHFFYMFSDYVMFLFRKKDVIQAIFIFFSLVAATSFDFLR